MSAHSLAVHLYAEFFARPEELNGGNLSAEGMAKIDQLWHSINRHLSRTRCCIRDDGGTRIYSEASSCKSCGLTKEAHPTTYCVWYQEAPL